MVPADTEALGEVYYVSYPPGVAGASVDEATTEIRATFDGELLPERVWVPSRTGWFAAAVRPCIAGSGPDTPDCPFIIELSTAPDHRRRGLGRYLVERVL